MKGLPGKLSFKHPQAEDATRLLEFCKIPCSRDEMQDFMGLSDREHFRLNILQPLLENTDLLLTIPDKPTSPKPRYYTNLKK